MDDEQSYFFQSEQYHQDQPVNNFQHIVSPVASQKQPIADKIVSSQNFWRAMKAEEMFSNYPLGFQKNYLANKTQNKYLTGLKGIIGLPVGKEDTQHKFLQCIDSEVFNSTQREGYKNLKQLFDLKDQSSPQMQFTHQLQELTKRFQEIQRKAFASISINKTIGKAFTEHFENFIYLQQQNTYLNSFNQSYENFLKEAKQINTPGIGLITLIYDFWMKMFKDFVREIWKHSQKYTLEVFKKQKGEIHDIGSVKSTISSSQNGGIEKERRKPWSKSELQIIQKIIDANGVFSQARLKQLGDEFGRTPSSISSKVQKILRNRKKNNMQEQEDQSDVSIQAKIKYILQMHPNGLTKEAIIQLINQNYEMGVDQSWKNSVSSILSSSKFEKLKMPFELKNPMFYYNYAFSSTFKDKMIQCMLSLHQNSGQIKTITREYIKMFIGYEPEPEQLKQLEQNISKTLSRYDIFQRKNSKIVYKIAKNPELMLGNQMDFNQMLNFR